MKHTYYYTYKVQCTAVGWEDYYYLGKHVTSNLNDGYKGSGTKLQEYYKQYPEDYTFTILEFYSNKTELNIAEQKLIGDLWKTDPYCLNLTSGGHGSWAAASKSCKGKHLSDERRHKISESNKKKLNTPEVKQKMSESRKGKQKTEEHKHKISESNKGKHSGENHPMYGKKHSKETRRKMSESNKGENNGMYGKQPWNKGIKWSDDMKSKISKNIKEAMSNPETKRKISESKKGKHRVYREDGTFYMSF